MYAGIDIGGSKTLAASLDTKGVILQKTKFKTNPDYDQFLVELQATMAAFDVQDYLAAGVGAPATHLDRVHGRGTDFGNLSWKNVPLQADIERLLHCPAVLENDAKMAALSEAMLLKQSYSKVLYVTISTGIGIGLVSNGVIDTSIGDGGGSTLLIDYQGKLQPWESFASGRAIVGRFGAIAEDINDPVIWKVISRDLAKGFIELIALMQPEVIVIGGSVGAHFHKYGHFLITELQRYQTPLLSIPPIRQAARPEEAVVFGCYDLAKYTFDADHAASFQQIFGTL